jgi:hypothetical protein
VESKWEDAVNAVKALKNRRGYRRLGVTRSSYDDYGADAAHEANNHHQCIGNLVLCLFP